MIKACIFDLDGTLTDTLDSILISVNETLKEMELPTITREQCRTFVGNGARVLMETSLKAVGADADERIDECMEIYGRIFDAHSTYHVVPYEEIPKLLTELKNQGVKLTVLSNKPHKQAVDVVEDVFGKELFTWVQGQKEEIPRKPDPTAAVAIAAGLGLQPEECMYIGDSEIDVATGTAAKMKTIGVTWGFRDRLVLSEAGAKYMVDKPLEILNLL